MYYFITFIASLEEGNMFIGEFALEYSADSFPPKSLLIEAADISMKRTTELKALQFHITGIVPMTARQKKEFYEE